MTNTQGNCIKYGKSRNIKQNIAVASYIGACIKTFYLRKSNRLRKCRVLYRYVD